MNLYFYFLQENFARSYLDTIQSMREKVLTGEKDPLKYHCDYDAGTVDKLLDEANRYTFEFLLLLRI